MQRNITLIFDFDSTFVSVESLDLLAERTLANNPEREKVLEEVKKITALGMEGKIPFSESLSRRLALFRAHKDDVEMIAEEIRGKTSRSIEKNKKWFKEHSENIHIISGGFKDMIFPTSRDFGIPDAHVHANTFVFGDDGYVKSADPNSFFSHNGGKAKALKELALPPVVVAIGDGWTDYEMKTSGGADLFLAFTENVRRENVAEKADGTFANMDELLTFIHTLETL